MTKTQWIILGAIAALLVIWYFYNNQTQTPGVVLGRTYTKLAAGTTPKSKEEAQNMLESGK